MDASELYAQVKETLEPVQFRDFAANIRALGAQPISTTLENIKRILGSERVYLYKQLEHLIKKAEERK